MVDFTDKNIQNFEKYQEKDAYNKETQLENDNTNSKEIPKTSISEDVEAGKINASTLYITPHIKKNNEAGTKYDYTIGKAQIVRSVYKITND